MLRGRPGEACRTINRGANTGIKKGNAQANADDYSRDDESQRSAMTLFHSLAHLSRSVIFPSAKQAVLEDAEQNTQDDTNMPPLTLPFMVWVMVERMPSERSRVLACARAAGSIGRGPNLLLHGEHHQIPFGGVTGPPHDKQYGTNLCPCETFHNASGPAARIFSRDRLPDCSCSGQALVLAPRKSVLLFQLLRQIIKDQIASKRVEKFACNPQPP